MLQSGLSTEAVLKVIRDDAGGYSTCMPIGPTNDREFPPGTALSVVSICEHERLDMNSCHPIPITPGVLLLFMVFSGCSDPGLLFEAESATNHVDSATVDDRALIQGTWEVVSTQSSGAPANDYVGSRTTYKNDSVICDLVNLPQGYPKDKAVFVAEFKLDVTTTPRSMDLIVEEDGKRFIIRNRVYLLDQDSLTICLELSCKFRPTEFKTLPGDDRMLYKLERVKGDSDGIVR